MSEVLYCAWIIYHHGRSTTPSIVGAESSVVVFTSSNPIFAFSSGERSSNENVGLSLGGFLASAASLRLALARIAGSVCLYAALFWDLVRFFVDMIAMWVIGILYY